MFNNLMSSVSSVSETPTFHNLLSSVSSVDNNYAVPETQLLTNLISSGTVVSSLNVQGALPYVGAGLTASLGIDIGNLKGYVFGNANDTLNSLGDIVVTNSIHKKRLPTPLPTIITMLVVIVILRHIKRLAMRMT